MPPSHPTHSPAPRFAALRFLSALLVCGLAAVVAAQEVYLWTDEDGIRHLSDRKPDGDYEVKVQRAIAQPEAPVEMTNVGSEREPEWRFSNRMHGPVAVEVSLAEAGNVVTEPALPARLELPALGHRSVLIGPLDPMAAWRYSIRMSATPGPLAPAADASYDDAYDYRLPFPPEQALGQDGFNLIAFLAIDHHWLRGLLSVITSPYSGLLPRHLLAVAAAAASGICLPLRVSPSHVDDLTRRGSPGARALPHLHSLSPTR